MEAKQRILVVDDEPQLTRVLRRSLTTKGYDVRVAGDGDDIGFHPRRDGTDGRRPSFSWFYGAPISTIGVLHHPNSLRNSFVALRDSFVALRICSVECGFSW